MIFILLFSSVLVSCKKESAPKIDEDAKRIEFARALGLDINTVEIKKLSIPDSNTLSFKSIEQAKAYFNNQNLNVSSRSNLTSSYVIQGEYSENAFYDTYTNSSFLELNYQSYVARADYAGRIFEMTFTATGNTNSYNITDIHSQMIGFVVGNSFTEDGKPFYEHTAGTTGVHIYQWGLLHYNIIIEDIGTIYSQPITVYTFWNFKNNLYKLKVVEGHQMHVPFEG